jgi:hypothetical protein
MLTEEEQVKVLARQLPQAYTDELYEAKVKAVYEHVYDAYAGRSVSVYGSKTIHKEQEVL